MKRSVVALAGVTALALSIYVAHGQPPADDRDEGGPRRVERQEGNRRAPGGRGGRRERGPAQKAPAKTGTVTEFTKNPDGETDGLRLDDGTQVRFRPDAGEKVTARRFPQGSHHDRRLDPFRRIGNARGHDQE